MSEGRQGASASPTPLVATIAGAFGGGANIFTGYPFDSVKVRLQASNKGTFSGPYDCFRHILRTEGVSGLYRGLSVPLIGGIVETGINYAAYTQSLKFFEGPRAVPQTSSLASVAAAAGFAGFVLSFVLSPAELVKCRMQMGLHPTLGGFAGPMDCIRHLIRTEGVRGLGRGLSGTLTRETFGNSVFFVMYETLRRQLPGRPVPQQGGQHQPPGLKAILSNSAGAIACGGLAGMAMWAAVLPVDVAKSRLQVAQPGTAYDVSLLRNMQKLYLERGLRGLYVGLSLVQARAFPANAAQWLVYEWVLRTGGF